MTGFGQCAACNDGYTLTSESTCQLGSENWASNTKVVRYAKQVVRDLVRHLDTNLDGNIDKNELNEKEIDEAIQRGIAGLRGGIIEGQVDSVWRSGRRRRWIAVTRGVQGFGSPGESPAEPGVIWPALVLDGRLCYGALVTTVKK